MTAWYTSHTISQKVIDSIKKGFKLQAKHVSLYKGGSLDPVYVYGVLRGCTQIIQDADENSTGYYHIDNGYFRRGHFDGYYRISKNNTQAEYRDLKLPGDRWEKLNVSVSDWRFNPSGYIIICPPSRAMAEFYDIDVEKWVDNIKKSKPNNIYRVRSKDSNISLKDELRGARCLVTYNSNAALEALVVGVPAIALSDHSIIREWNMCDIDDLDYIENIHKELDREKALG